MATGNFRSVRRERTPGVGWSAAQFAFLMAALYVVRPLRDELGIQSGVENMQWLFTGTFVMVLVIAPVYAWSVSRLSRRIAPWVFGAIAFSLAGARVAVWLEGGDVRPWLASGLFVWISAFNLFAVSVFWSLVVDAFSAEAARRTFGQIAAGGTAGALTGPLVTTLAVTWLPPADLLWIAAGLLVLAAGSAHRLSVIRPTTTPAALRSDAVSVLRGFALTLRQPRLRRLCGYLLCMTWVSTVLYFEQAQVVASSELDSAARTTVFASIDLAVNVLTLIIQVFFTARILRWLGLATLLLALPVASGLVLVSVSIAPLLLVVLIAQAIRRATNFALARPARELLFTDVDRASKFEGKNVVDTVVYRGGDAAAGWAFAGLEAAGLGLGAIAALAIPVVGVWGWLGVQLGRDTPKPSTPTISSSRARASRR